MKKFLKIEEKESNEDDDELDKSSFSNKSKKPSIKMVQKGAIKGSLVILY